MEILENLSTREKQAYGAMCLYKYCKIKGIAHQSINELLNHLVSILISEDLATWERKGAVLDLSGRGDPIPNSLTTYLSNDMIESFTRLVDYVVEIGFVDMYGRSSTDPLMYLQLALDVLYENKIQPPDIQELFPYRKPRDSGSEAWGETVSKTEYERIQALIA
ncbi:MAG: hypothetical protein WCI11_08730 [Candidatus Methylumidiphilus sp.]